MIIKIEQKIVKDNGKDDSTSYNFYYFECDSFLVMHEYDDEDEKFSPNQLIYDRMYNRDSIPSLLKLYKNENCIGTYLFSYGYVIDNNTGKTIDKIY